MRSSRIASTVYLLLGFSLLAGGAASAYLTVRCAGIGAAYFGIIQGEIRQAQQVRVLQVTFKKQVQAWKDILLRGKDDAALAKYDAEFHSLAEKVQSASGELAGEIRDEQARTELETFRSAHRQLGMEYESALADYRSSRDFALADAAVKGKDRPPTDALDRVADRLTALAEAVPVAEGLRLHREQRWLTIGLTACWLGLAAWSVAFTRSLGTRLGRCVQFVEAIAGGDLTAATPEAGGMDEVGLLIEVMSRMRDRLREMVGSIQSVAGTMSSQASEAADSSGYAAHAAANQRRQAAEAAISVSSALEEMVASLREVTSHCAEAAQHAAHTGELAAQTGQTVESAAGEVRELAADSRKNAETVKQLGERSSQIGRVVTLIEEIAGQTNLLALNAAIEAARAGEHGRGFAVVAGEVRRLAERTTGATREIADAVGSIQQGTRDAVSSIEGSSKRVEASVASTESALQSLSGLGTSAEEVKQRIERIACATEQQSQASSLIGHSMNEITARIAATSEGADEAARISGEMVKLAGKLQEEVSHFRT
jgi:methyl-accepting chemotaxis protein